MYSLTLGGDGRQRREREGGGRGKREREGRGSSLFQDNEGSTAFHLGQGEREGGGEGRKRERSAAHFSRTTTDVRPYTSPYLPTTKTSWAYFW
jgi:hypothetical protein